MKMCLSDEVKLVMKMATKLKDNIHPMIFLNNILEVTAVQLKKTISLYEWKRIFIQYITLYSIFGPFQARGPYPDIHIGEIL